MKNIHVIFNAHLDPVWLWPWQAGLDESLATCRSACDRLDKHPDIVFTRAEAWVYDMVEKVDPALFARIKGHVEADRWEITGGWWIQPDCNAASGWAWERQIEVGQRYFQSRFGIVPNVGYNVDSFGHAATLPKLLRDHGQEYYVMMRPGEHEKSLPAGVFRWRGYEDGPEVIVFRIAAWGYCTRDLGIEHFESALKILPEGIEDTMCFVGVGDHGGGPTEKQIAWIREHQNDIPGARIIFSSPSRYFNAIRTNADKLPLVTGELQMHAVGCYTVHRGIKTAVRRAEHIVYQAETHAQRSLDPALLEKSWQYVSFAQFHDTLGGTCLPTAYQQVIDQLGFASASSDEAIHLELRRKIVNLPDNVKQRIVAWNASDKPFGGYVEFEPWLEWQAWQPHWRLLDEAGIAMPYQVMHGEAQAGGIPRLIFHSDLEPSEIKTLTIDRSEGKSPASPPSKASGANGALSNDNGVTVSSSGLKLGGLSLPRPLLQLIEDTTDTWSHNTDRYSEESVTEPLWQEAKVINDGPLMAASIQNGIIGDSRLTAEWRVYAGLKAVDLRLTVHWQEKFKILKLALPVESSELRIDGISGGQLERPGEGKEVPLRDWTLLTTSETTLGILAPDVYAMDGTSSRIRFTLLRSPYLAWHIPDPGGYERGVFSDQGVHEFRFRFIAGANAEELDNQAIAMQRPLIMADVTKGMPSVHEA